MIRIQDIATFSAAREAGMRTLRQSALRLAADGITSIDEAVENTVAELQ